MLNVKSNIKQLIRLDCKQIAGIGKQFCAGGEELRLRFPRRVNSKGGREPWLEIYKLLLREYIERDDWSSF